KDPNSAEAHYKLALVQRATNDNNSALTSLLHAVALNPDLDSAQIELGDVYLGGYLNQTIKNAGVYQRISDIAARLLHKDPKYYPGLGFGGYIAISEKNAEKALSYFNQANEIRPGQADVTLALGQALWLAGRYDQARKTIFDFIAGNKTFGPAYDFLYAYE